jgi:beta-lactamase superfamily II metal-dependent hydrolase
MPVAGSGSTATPVTGVPRATNVLRITFVDVGQGDAIVLRSGSWTGLIDGGPSGAGPRIEAVLHKLKATHLDCLVITHPHADHIGGLAKVVSDYKPTTVVYGTEGTTAIWRNLKSELTNEGATFKVVRTDAELQFGRVKAKVLSPSSLVGDANSDSVVIDVTAGGKQFLFTGDVTGTHEADVGSICARGPPIYLLKVAHHGSKYSTTDAFLSQTRPKFAVICVGKNSYGHPSPATIARLKAHKVRVYSTLKNGNISLVVSTAGKVTWAFSRTSTPLSARAAATEAKMRSLGGAVSIATSTVVGSTLERTANPWVYITDTGKKYHRAGCKYLAHSKHKVRLKWAKSHGYKPCKVCKPPT